MGNDGKSQKGGREDLGKGGIRGKREYESENWVEKAVVAD